MKMNEAVGEVQVAGAGNASKKLVEGWTPLAVVPSANNASQPHVAYALGKGEAAPEKKNVGLMPP